MNDSVSDIRQRLEQLNRIEDQLQSSRQWGNGCASDEAIIESLRGNLSLSVLIYHDRLRARGRRSVAEVRHGVCSGCHMALPIGTAAAIKRKTELLKCDNCGRYIFLCEEEVAAVMAPRMKSASSKNGPKELSVVH